MHRFSAALLVIAVLASGLFAIAPVRHPIAAPFHSDLALDSFAQPPSSVEATAPRERPVQLVPQASLPHRLAFDVALHPDFAQPLDAELGVPWHARGLHGSRSPPSSPVLSSISSRP